MYNAAYIICRLSCLLAVLLAAVDCGAEEVLLPIPASEVATIQSLYEEGIQGDTRSDVASRRALKNTARKGLALVEKYPKAANRFHVLGFVFESQKRMLAMSPSDRNREALFRTCEQLLEAPDAYSEERLEADLLLSDRNLTAQDATLEERAQALAELLRRYSGTKAEARSLLMAALIVQKLASRELESQILYTLDEKFADDHEVIEFRRAFLKISRLDLVFSGRHERMDGTQMVFPFDTMGHMSVLVFWSSTKPGIDTYLESIKTAIAEAPGRLDVYSFNVDRLPDGGASFLEEHGVDWTVMKLPNGRHSQAYRSYAQGDPIAVLVNDYGVAVTRPEIVHGRSAAVDGTRISDDRYMVQLQSLFAGDFLFASAVDMDEIQESDDAARYQTIVNSIELAPFRYRQSRDETMAMYSKAAELVEEMVSNSGSDNLWAARNLGILARMGMWKTACDPTYLEDAVREAELVMQATSLPAEALVVPRFCLARDAIRAGSGSPESVVTSFVDDCGGANAPASAIAAAAILSIEARSREMYDLYRERFLAEHAEDSKFYSFTAFLRDRHLQYRILKGNHNLRERRARGYIVGHSDAWPTNNILPDIELMHLDGSVLRLPEETNGKLTYLLFVEPPAGGGTNNWFIEKDSRGRIRHQSGVHGVTGYANDLTKTYQNGDINFVLAFLTDDVAHVKYLVQTNGWQCTPAIVPNGLHNAMVRRLGVFSADTFPNVFVLRRNGSIAWHGSGLKYKNEFGYPFAVLLAMKVHIELSDIEYAFDVLATGDYEKAVRAFANPFPDERPQRFGWRSPRYHGQALAYMGLGDWELALDTMEKSIDAHKLRHFHGYGRRSSNLADWRKDAAKVTIEEPCDIVCMLWQRKADLLDKLGRTAEAESLREKAADPKQEHRPYLYEEFHQKLYDLSVNAK